MNLRRLKNFVSRAGIVAAISFAVPAFATTYDFSFYGSNSNGFGQVVTLSGSGSFGYSGTLTSVWVSDLTAFSLTDSFYTDHGPGSGQWAYSLGDLVNLTYAPGSQFTLDTKPTSVLSDEPLNYDVSLSIAGFNTNQVTTSNGGSASITSFINASTPEPATYGLMILSVLLSVPLGLKRKRML